MPGATRLGDHSTGHDACVRKPLMTASEDVFINGLGAGRVTDLYHVHGCPAHPPHNDYIAKGSSSVFINGLSAGRINDPVGIAGAVDECSDNVFIGG